MSVSNLLKEAGVLIKGADGITLLTGVELQGGSDVKAVLAGLSTGPERSSEMVVKEKVGPKSLEAG